MLLNDDYSCGTVGSYSEEGGAMLRERRRCRLRVAGYRMGRLSRTGGVAGDRLDGRWRTSDGSLVRSGRAVLSPVRDPWPGNGGSRFRFWLCRFAGCWFRWCGGCLTETRLGFVWAGRMIVSRLFAGRPVSTGSPSTGSGPEPAEIGKVPEFVEGETRAPFRMGSARWASCFSRSCWAWMAGASQGHDALAQFFGEDEWGVGV